MEGMNNMLRVATQNRWTRRFKVSNITDPGMEICLPVYTDDTMIFCETKVEQIRYIREILVILEVVAAPIVNWKKSSLFPVKEEA
ncbi:hypothetical protein H5410_023238 [Solanum commersonii]|uniref:Reverse transcriptase domain-containing protein n=1 Tax=Solanum commersonii TaxID=4109 RepID=A0A9J5ZHQ2_SOLCO|nr:hypothetical protein H5410_023238 [Solanum commersonii]